MSAVENGVITQTSVSQVERFDHSQKGGCQRAWWFERVHFLRPDQSAAAAAGEAGHQLFAQYFRTGKLPDGRAKMKKVVSYAIVKGDLPKPGPDLLVEWRGDGQEKFDPTKCECGHAPEQHEPGCSAGGGCECEGFRPSWIPLDKEKTLSLGGVPWELFADLAYCRDEIPTVMDHKFSTDVDEIAKPNDGLIKTVQMPVYVLGLRNRGYWLDAPRWRILHNYNSRTAGKQFFRGAVVSLDQVFEREAQIAQTVEQMKIVAKATNQDEVPFNRKSCDAWLGCSHQSICRAFKENKVNLSPEEAALFKGIDSSEPVAPAEDDELAKMEKKLAEMKAAKEAKAKADAAAKAYADAQAAAEKKRRLLIVDVPAVGATSVLPPDAPPSDLALASEQPKIDAKKKKADQITFTVTIDAANANALRALFGK